MCICFGSHSASLFMVNGDEFSEHAVSNPIMVQGNGGVGIAGSITSPRENSLCTQMIANVLGSSPGSLTAHDAKFVNRYSVCFFIGFPYVLSFLGIVSKNCPFHKLISL